MIFLIFLFVHAACNELPCFQDPSTKLLRYYGNMDDHYYECGQIIHEASALTANEKRELQTKYREFRSNSWHDAVSTFARKQTYKCAKTRMQSSIYDYAAPFFLYSENVVKKFGKYAAYVKLNYTVHAVNTTTPKKLREGAVHNLLELSKRGFNIAGCATTFGCAYTLTHYSVYYIEYFACVFTPLKIEGKGMKYSAIEGNPCTRCDFYENDELTTNAKLDVKSNTCNVEYPNLCHANIDEYINDDSVGCVDDIMREQRIFINTPNKQVNSKCASKLHTENSGSSKSVELLFFMFMIPSWLTIVQTFI